MEYKLTGIVIKDCTIYANTKPFVDDVRLTTLAIFNTIPLLEGVTVREGLPVVFGEEWELECGTHIPDHLL